MDAICADLAAETDALGSVVSSFSEEQWRAPTPAEGWDSRETVVHLGTTDWVATMAVAEPDEFERTKQRMLEEDVDLHNGPGIDFAALGSDELWDWFRTERAQMIEAFRGVGPKDRIPWFGPDMGARMFATARLMETWSHGHDVADTVGATYPQSERLQSVAHIGVVTRGWSYANRGLDVPAEPIRIELTSPAGATWMWGPEDADSSVTGSAYDFCLAVTQRRHYTETGLTVTGAAATDWMEIAQAFAGPPTAAEAGRTG